MNLQMVTAYYTPGNRKIDKRLMKVIVDLDKFVAAFPNSSADGCIDLVFVNHCTITVSRIAYVALMKEIGINGFKFMPEVNEPRNC